MSQTRPHILILVENLPVPFDRRVWMESLALRDAGYRVSVISPQPPDDDQFDRVIDGVNVYRYPEFPGGKGKLNFVKEFWYAYWQTRRIAARVCRPVRLGDTLHGWLKSPFLSATTPNPGSRRAGCAARRSCRRRIPVRACSG